MKVRSMARFVALVMLFTAYITMTLTFAVAYFTDAKVVLVTINSYGEAFMEAVILVVTFIPVALFALETAKGLAHNP